MALYSMIGALLTLGVYGVWKGRAGTHSVIEWTRSFLPMGMAAGDLGVLIASRYGQISIVTPLTGAYRLSRSRSRCWCCARADLAAEVRLHRRDPGRHVLLHFLKACGQLRERIGDVARTCI
jgi:hypothetical protein